MKSYEEEIQRVLNSLSVMDPASTDYTTAVNNLRILTDAQSKKRVFGLEPSVVLTNAVNLVLASLILGHERFNVVNSKAFSFLKTK